MSALVVVQVEALNMDEVNRLDARDIEHIIHDEAVTGLLWVHPRLLFQSEVATNTVQEFPRVGDVAWLDMISPHFLTILAE